jgi:hypothetical protein
MASWFGFVRATIQGTIIDLVAGAGLLRSFGFTVKEARMDQLRDKMKKPHRLTNTVRHALFDTRNFLRSINKRSDEVAEKQNSMRCYEAQQHYNEAKELIERINEILR